MSACIVFAVSALAAVLAMVCCVSAGCGSRLQARLSSCSTSGETPMQHDPLDSVDAAAPSLLAATLGCSSAPGSNGWPGSPNKASRHRKQQNEMLARQSEAVIRENQRVTEAAKALVEQDATARQEMIAAQRQLSEQFHAARSGIDRERASLEQERREIAAQRHRDPVVGGSCAYRRHAAAVPDAARVGRLRLVSTRPRSWPTAKTWASCWSPSWPATVRDCCRHRCCGRLAWSTMPAADAIAGRAASARATGRRADMPF